MKYSILAFLFSSLCFASTTGKFHVTGTYVGATDKFVEVKTANNSLLIPKEFVSKQQLEARKVIEVDVNKADLDKIKIKK